MHFSDAHEFVKVFGAGSTSARLGQAIGISSKTATRLAQEHGQTPIKAEKLIPGLEHLPGLPSFCKSRSWRGGTIHSIDCRISGDSPGYRSLLIHQSCRQDDEEDFKDD